MDFMKVFDQTVRDIKREVNLKVLKVPEIEQKIVDATSEDPWGPHGADLAEIARATRKLDECQMIMNVLWQRLGDTGAYWRRVYKALSVIEYLLANGTERAVDVIIDNGSQITKLVRFEYLEPNGKDVGLNVRMKAETILAIMNDREKLQQIREKAAATRDKYSGLSSTGVGYKSSSASSGSHYGSTGGSSSFKDSYKGTERRKSNKETMPNYSSNRGGSKEITNSSASYKSTQGERHDRRIQDSSASHSKSFSNLSTTSGATKPTSSQKEENEDDDFNPRNDFNLQNDFNPRGSSTYANARSNQLDLFGPSLMDDLVNTAASSSTSMPTGGIAAVPEVDLFADAAFQSSSAPLEASMGSHAQNNIDLFAGRMPSAGSCTSEADFSVRGSPNKSSEQNLSSLAQPSVSAHYPFQPPFATSFPSDTEFSVHDPPSKSSQGKPPTPEHSNIAAFDPFAAIPLKSFDGSESFGAFSLNTGSNVTEQTHGSPGVIKSSNLSPSEELNFGAFTSHTESPTVSVTNSMNKPLRKLEQDSASRSAGKKQTFQVKSDIWADCLNRGLIDLNITSPKKVNLADVGVVGQLSDGSEEKRPAPWYMEATMCTGSGTSGNGSFQQQQQQFGSFK